MIEIVFYGANRLEKMELTGYLGKSAWQFIITISHMEPWTMLQNLNVQPVHYD